MLLVKKPLVSCNENLLIVMDVLLIEAVAEKATRKVLSSSNRGGSSSNMTSPSASKSLSLIAFCAQMLNGVVDLI